VVAAVFVHFQTEISELSSLIADKLDFLEVTRAGLSKLQMLLVQFEVCHLAFYPLLDSCVLRYRIISIIMRIILGSK